MDSTLLTSQTQTISHQREVGQGTSSIVVIVPVFNRARTVIPTLDAVASQTLPPAELMVIDDGSSDDLEGTIRDWQRDVQPTFPVRYMRQEHHGVSTARNLGIQAASDADYYAFLDSDDLWPIDFLARAHQRLNENPNAVAASADRVHEDYTKGFRRLDPLDSLESSATAWLVENGSGIGSATVFRGKCIREFGGYDDSKLTGEDCTLFLPLSLHGQWLHLPGKPVVYGIGKAKTNGECDHLFTAFDNYWERWASVLEDFIEQGGGREHLPDSFCDQKLGIRWYRAGKQAARAGRYQLAQKHFRRSLQYRNSMKTRLKMLKAIFRAWLTRWVSVSEQNANTNRCID